MEPYVKLSVSKNPPVQQEEPACMSALTALFNARSRASLTCLMMALTALPLQVTSAQGPELFSTPLDCVIYPSVVAELSSSAPGVLRTITVKRSELVQQGEVVAQLESSAEQAALDVIQARVESELEIDFRRSSALLAKRELERAKEVSTADLLSSAELDSRKTDASLSQIQLAQAEENRRFLELELRQAKETLQRRSIRSPINGLVTHQLKQVGEYVDGDPVIKVAQLDPLHVETIVSADYLGDIVVGMQAAVRSFADKETSLTAVVETVDKVVDVASGTFGVQLSLPNPEYRIAAGLRCTVQFEAGAPAVAAALSTEEPLARPSSLEEPTLMEPASVEPEAHIDASESETLHAPTPVPAKAADTHCEWPRQFSTQTEAQRAVDQLAQADIPSRISTHKVREKKGHKVVSQLLPDSNSVDHYREQLEQAGISDIFLPASTSGPVRLILGSFITSKGALRRLEQVLKPGLMAEIIPWTVEQTQYWVTPDVRALPDNSSCP